MPSWKKVIVSGSQTHLSGITSSVLSDNNLLIAGNVGQIENSGLTYNGTTLAIGGANIISTGPNSILTGSFTGSFAGTFTGNLNSVILANDNNGRQYSTNGGTTASLNTITFRDTDTTSDVTQSIGRIAFESSDTDTSGSNNSQLVRAFIEAVSEDATPDTFLAFGTAQSGSLALERMRINSSGNIGIGTTNPALGLLQLGTGTENPHANLYINGGVGHTGSITVRASNGFNSSIQKTYNPIGGSDSLNFIQLLDFDTSTIANQPIGRIIFTSLDTDTTGSGTTKAFIEAVAEDDTPDSFLAFGTAQSGSLVQERMRINSLGSVGIGTTTPTNTLQVAGSGIATTNLTASGNISSSAGLIGATLTTSGNGTIGGNLSVNGNTTLGNASADTVTVNAQTLTLANQLAVDALSSTMLVITSSGRVATQTLGSGVATFLNNPSAVNLEAAVAENTGTGNLVFSASPTFTGTVNAANITADGNLIVSGSTTLGDESGDSVTINAATIGIANVGAGTTDTVLIRDGSNTIKTRTIDNRVWGSTLIGGSLTTNRVPFAFDANTITDDSSFTYNAATDVLTVNGSTFGQNVVVSGNATITGDLTVNGTTTILNVENVMVEDRFILLASGSISGSATHADGGIIVQYTTGSGGSPTGSALFLNSKVDVTPQNGQSNQTFSARWGLNNSVGHTQTTLNPTDYLVSVTRSQAVPTAAPEFGGQLLGFGNMYIQNNGDIWFWSPDLADEEGNIVYAG